jgi:hypothetical protein
MLPEMLKGTSPPVISSGAIASGPPMKVSSADTRVSDPGINGADQTNQWRVKRRRNGNGKKRKAFNLGNHVRHHIRTFL